MHQTQTQWNANGNAMERLRNGMQNKCYTNFSSMEHKRKRRSMQAEQELFMTAAVVGM